MGGLDLVYVIIRPRADAILRNYLKMWFAKPVLSPSTALRVNSVEGLTKNGQGFANLSS